MKKKVEVVTCDYCKDGHKLGNEVISVSAAIGRSMDAAGGTQTDYLSFDLCPVAAEDLLRQLLETDMVVPSWFEDRVRTRRM